MFGGVKSISIQTKPAVSTLFSSSNNFVIKTSPVVIGTVRFQQASAGHQQAADHNMEKNQEADQNKQQHKESEKNKG